MSEEIIDCTAVVYSSNTSVAVHLYGKLIDSNVYIEKEALNNVFWDVCNDNDDIIKQIIFKALVERNSMYTNRDVSIVLSNDNLNKMLIYLTILDFINKKERILKNI